MKKLSKRSSFYIGISMAISKRPTQKMIDFLEKKDDIDNDWNMFSLRLKEGMLKDIDKAREYEGESRTSWIRKAIMEKLKRVL